jgi:dihydrofolate reductase
MASLSDIIIVVAVSKNGVIGRGNTLPWKLRSDLQRFKQLTMGHALIMGRKTWDSIAKLLQGRTTIVISRTMSLPMNGDGGTGPLVVRTLEEAVAQTPAGQFPMVVGGAEIYRLALPHCRQLWLTRVEAEIAGDTFFPKWQDPSWKCVEQTPHPAGDRDEFPTTFEKWVRQ